MNLRSTSKPNLFIVGVAKAGTSALFNSICQHPDICGSDLKEPHFFTHNIYRPPNSKELPQDLSNYLNLFDLNTPSKYQCEASTSYFWDLEVPEIIYDYNPQAKVIVMLRNPITRAYSHYEMEIHSEREKNASFLAAILADEQRKERTWGKSRMYVDLGYYADSIEKYSNLFKENLLVIKYEEFAANAFAAYGAIWEFLELKDYPIINYTVNKSSSYNSAGRKLKASGLGKLLPKKFKPYLKMLVASGKDKIAPDAYAYLLSKYYDDIKKLSKLGFPYYDELLRN